MLLLKLIFILAVANGTPVLARKFLGDRCAWPLDGGLRFVDRRPLFGASKTVRGALLSVLLSTATAPLLGLPIGAGALIGALAMIGDLLSSFAKRRLGFAPSQRATGLDQIPESLLPLIGCRYFFLLDLEEIALGTAIFCVGEIVLSRLLYRLKLRERPY